jgi:tetratricopeptide (TPR) repeat protein
MKKLVAFAPALLAVATPAGAAWHKAESAHFVVYADDSARDVAAFAELLERFHAAMGFITGREQAVPSPSNRVVIYAVGSQSRVQQLIGDKSGTVAGFYAARAGNSRAFVPDIRVGMRENDISLTILLHEYAHHFLLSTSRYAMPRWIDEGAADFFASAKFERDGTIGIGRPAHHRAAELTYAADVKVEELLDHELYQKRHGKGHDAFYGRAWALYHYLAFENVQQGPRKGQLSAYLRAITGGKSEREAATIAFGELKQLEKDLDAYLKRRRMNYFRIPPEKIPVAKIAATALSPGEGAVMQLRIESQSGVDRKEALELVPKVRKVAAQFPQDAAVFAALAEAEFDAGNDVAAIAAADKAIALDGTQTNAYVQKGYALFRMAEAAPGDKKAAAMAAALKPFQALNRLENDHPLPLVYFYRSFTDSGREPTELARHALERASHLAPFDRDLTFQTALMQAGEGKIALAKLNLLALAANPHGGALAAHARKLADEIGALEEGKPWTGLAIMPIDVLETAEGGGKT